MYQEERIESILAILKKNRYVTVKYLTQELCYSNATINRDLNVLEKRKLIKRSYGGVELESEKSIPLVFRYHKMKSEKNKIAKKAAEFVSDGDTIFIDGSTTSQYIVNYLTAKKDITVITNNIQLVIYFSEYGIKTICLGGEVAEPPYMLCGAETIEKAKSYFADKMFFSVAGITDDGKIFLSEIYYLLLKTMLENSKQSFLLIDSGKIDKSAERIMDFCDVDNIISDYEFKQATVDRFKDTKFIKV